MGLMRKNNCIMLNESPILYTEGIYKKYAGTTVYANENINLSVEKGQICGLLGPNGAGKTTFVRQVCGLLRPSAGRIEVGGVDISSKKNYVPSVVSYLGQIAYTHRALKVIEFIQFTGIYRGISKKLALDQAKKYLEYFEMQSLENKLLEYLSGGETRIVAFIAAIVGLKPLIVLDEPTNDVDPEKRIKLWQLVKSLKIEHHISFLLVTHNIHEAADVVDQVVIMNNGKIIKKGIPNELANSLEIDSKIDFTVPYDYCISPKILEDLHIIRLDNENFRIYVEKENIYKVLNYLYSHSIGKSISSIKIIPPSLEDIYLNNIEEKD